MSETVVELPPELTIGACRALHERLMGVLEEGRVVVLDAGSVERIDSAALQTLAAFVAGAQAGVSWRAPAACVREAAALLGLESMLALDAA